MSLERGRPRSFDLDEALDKAVEVFWRHGFQSASFSELTRVTGLSKPSLYAAFGDKEALYLQSLKRYAALLITRHGKYLMDETDGRKAIEAFLYSMAEMLADPQMPGGCFIVNGTADCGTEAVPAQVEQALCAALNTSEALIGTRLLQAQQDGHLPNNAQPEDLAAFFAALVAGLAVQAKSGADKNKLEQVVKAGMAVWPISA